MPSRLVEQKDRVGAPSHHGADLGKMCLHRLGIAERHDEPGALALGRIDRSGIGYIPRERRVEGLVLFLPVAANMALATLKSLTRWGTDQRRQGTATGRGMGRAAAHPDPVDPDALSQPLWRQPAEGGCWPKVRVLILDHPTRGLDVGTKEEVYDLVRAVTAEGLG